MATSTTNRNSIDLRVPSSNDIASVVPARGALVTRWHARGRERLYLDRATLDDPTKNVRGGVPVLFPSPGKLADGRFARDGRLGALKQHGFARDLAWDVASRNAASVNLTLDSNEATRAVYPWSFRLTLEITLSEAHLRLAFRVANTGHDALPFAFGLHPYFLAHEKAGATIETAATRAFDNVTGQVVPFRGFQLGRGETDLHLLDHGSSDSRLGVDGSGVTVRASPELGRWVVWTLPGRDFVCLEPWTAPANALNTGESLLTVGPGNYKDLWVELEAE